MTSNSKKSLGQYFTPPHVAEFMISLSGVSKNARVLEPSSGEGVFLKLLNDKGFSNTLGFEIDATLEQISNSKVVFKSFLNEEFQNKFDLIVGNPPYIRWKNLSAELKTELENNNLWNKYFNSLCDYLYIFILKSIELLEEGGELIFITPEYWINTKHSISLRNYMVENGFFTHIYHFNETPIFDKVASSIVIFKYIKHLGKDKQKNIKVVKYQSTKKLEANILKSLFEEQPVEDAEYLTIEQFRLNERWLLCNAETRDELKLYENKCKIRNGNLSLFSEPENGNYHTIGKICDIGNGMVSGLDKAFQLPADIKLTPIEETATIKVIKAKSLSPYFHNGVTSYIFLSEVQNENTLKIDFPNFFKQLQSYKEQLDKRYNYNRDIKYWEWVFLRGYKLFQKPVPKIFVPCKERISNKDYFRFALAEPGIYPTQDVTALAMKPDTKEDIFYILALLNNHRVFHWLKYNGVVKGNIVEFSEKPLASIPIRLIDWSDKKEIELHNKIANTCKEYVLSRDENKLKETEKLVDLLF